MDSGSEAVLLHGISDGGKTTKEGAASHRGPLGVHPLKVLKYAQSKHTGPAQTSGASAAPASLTILVTYLRTVQEDKIHSG